MSTSQKKTESGWSFARLFNRRRRQASLPPLLTAMRQLRQHVLDAYGEGASDFAQRAEAIAGLARENGELETSAVLMKLAMTAELGASRDIRAALIELLDEAHAALNPPTE